MKTLTLFFVLALAVSVAGAQWVQTNAPLGSSVFSIAISGTKIFAGTDDGVYVSTDKGRSWATINNGLPDYAPGQYTVRQVATNGQVLYAGPSNTGGVYHSTDDGTTWTQVNTGLPDCSDQILRRPFPVVHCFAVNGTTIYAATTSGVFVSTNGGSSWKAINAGLPISYYHNKQLPSHSYYPVNALAVIDSTIFAAFTKGDSSTVYLSTNAGASWTPTSISKTRVNSFLVNGTSMYVGTNSGVFRTTNNGASWVSLSTGLSVQCLAAGGTNLFAGTAGDVFLSTNNGASWSKMGALGASISCLGVSGPDLFAGTWNCGVVHSSNNGNNWTTSSLVPRQSPVRALLARDANLFAGIQGTQSGAFRSTDNGANWILSYGDWITAFAGKDTNLFAGTGGNGIIRSSNNGATWVGLGDLAEVVAGEVVAIALKDANIFVSIGQGDGYGGGGGVILSTNNGTTWNTINAGLPLRPTGLYLLPGYFVNVLAAKDSNIYASSGGVYVFNPSGLKWTAAGLTNMGVTCFAFSGEYFFAGTNKNGVFLYSNVDTTWTAVSSGLGNASMNCLAVSGTNLFAGTDRGVFLSMNNGSRWTQINSGLTDTTVSCLAANGTYLFAGTNSGVWRRPLAQVITSAENLTRDLPTLFTLSQNYPNPFNPTTVVSYQLPVASSVRLLVYDLLGREVAVMVDENKPAGVDQVQFDATGLASGIYLYRMTAGTYTSTRKFVVVK